MGDGCSQRPFPSVYLCLRHRWYVRRLAAMESNPHRRTLTCRAYNVGRQRMPRTRI